METTERLAELGFLASAEGATGDEVADAVREFQRDRWLAIDGFVGPITKRHLAREPYCGTIIPKQARGGRACRWDHAAQASGWDGAKFTREHPEPLELSWHFANPPSKAYAELMREAFRRIEEVCAVVFVETGDGRAANFLEVCGRIDGRGSTLALHYLPCGRETRATQLGSDAGEPSGTFDNAEAWDLSAGRPSHGRTSWIGTVIHEIGGHGLGLEHGPETSIMSPYSNGVTQIDDWTRGELVRRYGPKIERTTVPVPPGFPPGGAEGTAEVRIGGLIYRGDLSLVGGE